MPEALITFISPQDQEYCFRVNYIWDGYKWAEWGCVNGFQIEDRKHISQILPIIQNTKLNISTAKYN